MTYTVSIDVDAPVAVYDAFHAALLQHTGGQVDGLLVHVAWPTGTGFRITEVWTSRELCDRANREIIPQVWAKLTADAPGPAGPPPGQDLQEHEACGLVIPSAGLAQ
ncbi:ribonuclease I [Actinoplanes octamycinicus]|uniref:Ribonuclease I n=1 Tax=Actinoplanes octamycinicus TaxID=135948 RepID=A0A7W7M9P1_9ACTN|nr:hypothetical protein [Actinoplanes octamycinicus]MBB4742066.1 ribonuclease I [Actinoplanes octamycinicus]GIE63698.1 hypothetical protein Aoc01nite_91000 [Actinoplanes octamycinicus]